MCIMSQMTGFFKNYIRVGIILFGGIFVSFCLMQVVQADTWSWTTSTPIIDSKDTADPNATGAGTTCRSNVSDVQVVGDRDLRSADCLVGETTQFKLYTFYDSSTNHSLAIQFAGEKVATRILYIGCPSTCTYLASTGDFVMGRAPLYSIGPVDIYKNFVAKLKLEMIPGHPDARRYIFDQSTPDKVVGGYLLNDGYVKHIFRSDNDRWLLLESAAGLLRYEVATGKLIKFSDYRAYYGPGAVVWPVFAISNDGQHAAAMGYNGAHQLIDITSACGVEMPTDPKPEDINARMDNPCPTRSLLTDDAASNPYIPYLTHTSSPQYSDDGGELSFSVTSSDASIKPRFIRLHAAGYTVRQLDYLALGDSYSSGEGDTEKDSSGKKFYRTLTDAVGDSSTPKENCHVSTRSYPYLLAKGMNLTINSQWNTVACSGAKVVDVTPGDTNSDRGQDSRLNGFSNYTDLKAVALNEFIPGRVKQIEFVKRYQPKVITLTMGGNDVGFVDKIKPCITGFDTCPYASDKKSDLKSDILNQYDNLKSLYEELYKASGPMVKIYVLGYPDFMNPDENVKCDLNVGALNTEERQMVHNGIIYLNNVIKQAAKAAGAKYIDIENSFTGHRFCDNNEKYITGITDALNWSHNQQETFHPNAKGHHAIAMSVWGEANTNSESLLDYDVCPDNLSNRCPSDLATRDTISTPDYFKNIDNSKNVEYRKMTASDQKSKSVMDIVFETFTFLPSSSVSVMMHSDPTDLGTFDVNDDGSLSISSIIPSSLPAGYHTLTVTGKSYSGDDISYEQIVLVKGSDPNDEDADGIVDSQDKCLFVPTSGKDQDVDGIDDGCDPEIGVEPVTPTPGPTKSPSPTPTSSPSSSSSNGQGPISAIVIFVTKVIKVVVALLSNIFSLLQKLLVK